MINVSGSPEPTELNLAFDGSAREYFRVWIVNLCLTLVTFGIFSAWAKVRKKRYIYSHTSLGGTPFQYLARPIPILKGRLIAAAGFGVYFICSRFVTSLMPYVLVAGLVAAPWVLSRSIAFNARFSAYRNMRFGFDGSYVDALKTLYAWAIVPLFAVGVVFNFKGQVYIMAISSLILSFHFPWLIRRVKKFMVEHTLFGGRRGEFSATGGQFFKIYFVSGLIVLAAVIPVALLFGVLTAVFEWKPIHPIVPVLPIYAAYVVAYAYLKARGGNLSWNNIRLGPLTFHSTMLSRDLIKLYFANALGIVFSFGLLIPWAVIRTYKYRVDHIQVIQTGTLYQFRGSEQQAVSAAGVETMDVFDMDLSL
jgi:uncharacterized membrane protein YjgN (DUF898 family)